jgi:FkbM family methyltransferase
MQQHKESQGGRGAAMLERARSVIANTNGLPWDAPSRFKAPGQAARRLLRRVLQPYTMRQSRVDAAIIEGLRLVTEYLGDLDDHVNALTARVEALSRARQEPNWVMVDYAAVQEIETVAGTLWYHLEDTLIAPAVKEAGLWEPDITALLPKVLRPGMTFVDVGANVGYFPVLASRLVGPEGHLVAVEPEPHNVTLLRANLWRNGVGNCAVYPVAAHIGQGYISMAVHDNIHDAWFAPGYVGVDDPAYDSTFYAPAARLDDLLAGRRVDVIKIDIEGADHLAVRGAEATIAANPEILVIVEFLPREEVFHGERREEVLAYYESLGFRLNLLSHDGELKPATAEQVVATGEHIDVINLALTRR